MMGAVLDVDPDITRARTPGAALYCDPEVFRLQTRLFARTWHLAPPGLGTEPGSVLPFTLLPGVLDAPLVLTRDDGGVVRCLSNVCTHRANLVAEEAGCPGALRCRYHGRRFSLSGHCVSMPEFDGVVGFPSSEDDLPEVASATAGPLHFCALDPALPFETLLIPIQQRLAFAPWSKLALAGTRDYEVAANWALYIENYLEGFHIPFVHPGLNQVVEYETYRTEMFQTGNVQIALASDDTCFELPTEHPDAGQRIAAYYFFSFPGTLVNVYPWGVSMNAIIPLGVDRTRIRFDTWVWDESKRETGAGAKLHTVELEDEAVVETVARGVRSPLYRRGRYSPSREAGVHHFHLLLSRALNELS